MSGTKSIIPKDFFIAPSSGSSDNPHARFEMSLPASPGVPFLQAEQAFPVCTGSSHEYDIAYATSPDRTLT
jgi:hypothetical protein